MNKKILRDYFIPTTKEVDISAYTRIVYLSEKELETLYLLSSRKKLTLEDLSLKIKETFERDKGILIEDIIENKDYIVILENRYMKLDNYSLRNSTFLLINRKNRIK